jgi:hypothetical protein
MKCAFCEMSLACRACGKPFRPRRPETFIAAYQPDMHIYCPECHAVLKCKSCGFVYGEEEDEEAAEG